MKNCAKNEGCVKGLHLGLCGVGPGTCQHFQPVLQCEICAPKTTKPRRPGGK